jgi:hypothetical protein
MKLKLTQNVIDARVHAHDNVNTSEPDSNVFHLATAPETHALKAQDLGLRQNQSKSNSNQNLETNTVSHKPQYTRTATAVARVPGNAALLPMESAHLSKARACQSPEHL